jgi:hypothetical protein
MFLFHYQQCFKNYLKAIQSVFLDNKKIYWTHKIMEQTEVFGRILHRVQVAG